MAAEHVQVGHHRLGVHVVRGVGRGGTGLLQVDALGAVQHLRHREAGRGLRVRRVRVDELRYSATARSTSPSPSACLGRGVPRVDLGLLSRRRDRSAGGPRLVPRGDALGGDLLHHLGEGGPQLVDRQWVLEQRHRPAVEDQHHQRDRGDLHRLSDRRRCVDVDRPARKRPSNSSDSVRTSSARVPLSGIRVRGVEHQHDRRRHRRLEHLLEVLLGQVHGVRRTARAAGGVGGAVPAGGPVEAPVGPPAGAAGRRRADRSIAPGRENGCWLMGTSSPMPGRGARLVPESLPGPRSWEDGRASKEESSS